MIGNKAMKINIKSYHVFISNCYNSMCIPRFEILPQLRRNKDQEKRRSSLGIKKNCQIL